MKHIRISLFLVLACMLVMIGLGAATVQTVLSRDFALDASLGLVSKYRTINKFGESDNLDAALTDIWDGSSGAFSALGGSLIWLPPTAAATHDITSSSALDIDSTGTGCRTVDVTGLESWDAAAETTETVVMNGTGDVETTALWVIIYRMECMTWGTGGLNAGVITATAKAPSATTLTAGMMVGHNQTQMMIYGISSRMKLRVTHMHVELFETVGAALRADGDVLFMRDPATNAVNGTAWTIKDHFELSTDVGWTQNFYPPKIFDGPGILKYQAIGSTTDIDIIASFDGFIKDD